MALAGDHRDRIRHAHLKDVDAGWAARVRSSEVSYTDAVRQGMYRPLGQGGIDIAGIVTSLEVSGYDGWYVLEQDTILSRRPADADGPMAAVRDSVAHLLATVAQSSPRCRVGLEVICKNVRTNS